MPCFEVVVCKCPNFLGKTFLEFWKIIFKKKKIIKKEQQALQHMLGIGLCLLGVGSSRGETALQDARPTHVRAADILSNLCADCTWQGKLGNSFSTTLWVLLLFIEGLNVLLWYPKALFKLVFFHDVFMILSRCGNGMRLLHMHVLKQLVQMDSSLTDETF